MAELEDMINNVLSSPEQMSKIMEMAKSIMPEGGGDGQPSEPGPAPGGGDLSGMMGTLGKLMGGGGLSGLGGVLGDALGGKKDDKRALLEAMTPYLGDKRKEKMTRAMQIAKIASVAGKFLSEEGEDNGD